MVSLRGRVGIAVVIALALLVTGRLEVMAASAKALLLLHILPTKLWLVAAV